MKRSEFIKELRKAGCFLSKHGKDIGLFIVEHIIFTEDMDKKEKVLVTIYRANDGSYWCHTEEDVYGCGLNSVGMSVEESKADLMECLEEARQDYLSNGGMAYDVEFRYQYDMQSFFEYFSFLNVTEIAKRAGINPSLMRQYTSGMKNAGEKTYARLSECMANITKELSAATFR